MANREIDPATFAKEERAAWDSVARSWRKWWPMFESAAQDLNDRLVALAGVEEGHHVLDIATGIGEPAVTAARIAGPSGHVLACDLSSTMLEIGRERAASLDVTNIEFAEQDASQLSTGDRPFDAAVCRWGLMLMLDPEAAVRGVHSALRDGGRFATAVWGSAKEVPFISVAGATLRRELDLPSPDPDEPGPFRLQDTDVLIALLADVGFCDVSTEPFTVHMEFDSPEHYVEFITDISSSARKQLDKADDPTRKRLLDAIAVEARAFAGADGRVRFENRVICTSGLRG